MTVVFDSIHGQIKFTGNAKEILDHKYFNRCENIKQLGEAHRVFPMALHTRKIHQIGTYLITKKYLEHLEKFVYISEREKELICIGGLCHDLGHVYGSHIFDNDVIRKLIKDNKIRRDHEWRDHEERSKILFEKIANEATDLNDDEIEFVKQIIHPSKTNGPSVRITTRAPGARTAGPPALNLAFGNEFWFNICKRALRSPWLLWITV